MTRYFHMQHVNKGGNHEKKKTFDRGDAGDRTVFFVRDVRRMAR